MSETVGKEACLERLKKMRSLIEITESDLDIIAGHFECRLVKKDQVLMRERISCDIWSFVHTGLLRIYSHKSTGEEYTN